jgi:hypothetical protein
MVVQRYLAKHQKPGVPIAERRAECSNRRAGIFRSSEDARLTASTITVSSGRPNAYRSSADGDGGTTATGC